MLEKYQSLIYKDEEEKQKVINECLDSVVERHHLSREEILKIVGDNEKEGIVSDVSLDYYQELDIAEGYMLFEKAVEKFGKKLWNGKAWMLRTCKKLCPFGDCCQKEIVKIDDESYCYGQLYDKGTKFEDLQELSRQYNVKILSAENEVILDLSEPDYDEQILSEFFFKRICFIMDFGDTVDCKGKVSGGRIIAQLQELNKKGS